MMDPIARPITLAHFAANEATPSLPIDGAIGMMR